MNKKNCLQPHKRISKGGSVGVETGKVVGRLANRSIIQPIALFADYHAPGSGQLLSYATGELGAAQGAFAGYLVEKGISWTFAVAKYIGLKAGNALEQYLISEPGKRWQMVSLLPKETLQDKLLLYNTYQKIVQETSHLINLVRSHKMLGSGKLFGGVKIEEIDVTDPKDLSFQTYDSKNDELQLIPYDSNTELTIVDNIHAGTELSKYILPERIQNPLQKKYYSACFDSIVSQLNKMNNNINAGPELEKLVLQFQVLTNQVTFWCKDLKKKAQEWGFREWFFYCIVPGVVCIALAALLYQFWIGFANLPGIGGAAYSIASNFIKKETLDEMSKSINEGFKWIYSFLPAVTNNPVPGEPPSLLHAISSWTHQAFSYFFSGSNKAHEEFIKTPADLPTWWEKATGYLSSRGDWNAAHRKKEIALLEMLQDKNKTWFDKNVDEKWFYPAQWNLKSIVQFIMLKMLDFMDYIGSLGENVIYENFGTAFWGTYKFLRYIFSWVNVGDYARSNLRAWAQGSGHPQHRIELLHDHLEELKNYAGGWVPIAKQKYLQELNHYYAFLT